MSDTPLRVGTVLYGFCWGEFGRDSYDNKRVEAIGADWVVVRETGGEVHLWEGTPEDLLKFADPAYDD